MSILRYTVLTFGVIGFLFFTTAFLVSSVRADFVEQVAKDIIHYQIEKTVHEKIESIDAQFLGKKAELFSKNHAQEIATLQRGLSENLPARIADTIAEMRNLDCECRKKIEADLRSASQWKILSATQVQERLTTLIRSKYMETSHQLTREFRIFTGSNALVFGFLVFAGFMRPQAKQHLLPVGLLLLVAAGLTAYLYLFNQNWLHTLVFSNYVGWGYIVYLGLAFSLLGDIVFNQARYTVSLLRNMGSSVPSFSVLPC